jgi:hypothetical protein
MKTRKGGGYVLKQSRDIKHSSELIPLLHEIVRLFKSPKFVGAGASGCVFSTTDASSDLCNPVTGCNAGFIMKCVNIEKRNDEIPFRRECSRQIDIYEKSLTMFKCPIVPMVIHYECYDYDEFQQYFPAIDSDPELSRNLFESDKRYKIGVLIMESFGNNVRTLTPADTKYFPLALREIYMLAQLGYKDASRVPSNFLLVNSSDSDTTLEEEVHSGTYVQMIDFGDTTPVTITDDEDEFGVLTSIYESNEDDLTVIDLASQGDDIDLAPIELVLSRLRMTDEMIESSMALIRALRPLILSGGKSKRKSRKTKRYKR